MGKPFKITGEQRANVARGGDGKFRRLEQESPQQVAEDAKRQGDTFREANRRARVPDHPVEEDGKEEGGDRVYKEMMPWPESGPVNDAGRPPMKLQG